MSQAADGNPNVTALVYVASFLAEVGESLLELSRSSRARQLGGAAVPMPVPDADGSTETELTIDPAQFPALFAGDVDPRVASGWPSRSGPSRSPRSRRPATRAAWRSIESWALLAEQDLAVPAELDALHGGAGRTPTWSRSTRPTP